MPTTTSAFSADARIFFGDALDSRAGWWTWPLLLGVLAVIALFALVVQRAFAIGRQSVRLDRLYAASGAFAAHFARTKGRRCETQRRNFSF